MWRKAIVALKLDNNLHYVKDKQDRVLNRRNHYRLKKTKEHTVRLPVVPEAVVLHSLSQQLTVAGKQRARHEMGALLSCHKSA